MEETKCFNCEQELNKHNKSSDGNLCYLCNGESCPCVSCKGGLK